MNYEVHVTVDEGADLTDFVHTAACLHAKPLFIELNKGLHAKQLMFGASKNLLTEESAINWSNNFKLACQSFGHNCIRLKLESELSKGYVEYWEAHWKFLGSPPKVNGFLLSRNSINDHTFYLSQRYSAISHSQAFDKFNRSSTILNSSFMKVHYERVIIDTNPSLDKGWADDERNSVTFDQQISA